MITKILKYDARFLFMALMLISLPSFEALKNIFAFAFVLSWIYIAKRNNDWGGKWQTIDSIFLLWIIADLIISMNAVITHQLSGGGFNDVFRFVLIGWVLSRTYFTKVRLNQLILITLIGSLVSLAYSYYIDNGVLKELHSVGHINHTAIFLLIAYSFSLSLLLFDFKSLSKFQKYFLLVSTLSLLFATIDTDSRASFGLLIIVTIASFIYLIIKSKKISLFFLLLGLVTLIGIYFSHSPPKALERIQVDGLIFQDYKRSQIRNFSYYAFRENPILGIGFGNYGEIQVNDIKASVIKDKGVFEAYQYARSAHAHNVYYNYLVSGGILVFSVFMWFWFYVVWIISKLILMRKSRDWIVISASSVVLVNLGIGWVNTTLHHEHALLTMFILGILISQYRLALQNQIFEKNSYNKQNFLQ